MNAGGTDDGQSPLVLIHGAWLSTRSWESCADDFAKRVFAGSARDGNER